MINGTVIGVARTASRTLVHVARCMHHPHHDDELCPDPVTNSFRVAERTLSGCRIEIEIGDFVWCQHGFCYWTPQAEVVRTYDIKLPFLG